MLNRFTRVCAVRMLLLLLVLPGNAGAEASLNFQRPIPEGGGPTMIHCLMGILDIDEIDDADQNFTVNVFTAFRWHDPRLAHDGPGNVKRMFSEIWHPSLIFQNRQKIWSSMGVYAEVTPEGEVIFRQQFWGDFSQPLNLHDFPFDQQSFGIRVISTGSESPEELVLVEGGRAESFVTKNYSVAGWQVTGHDVDTNPVVAPNIGEFPSFTMSFHAKRIPNHYVIKVIAPLLLIVLLSQVVFWLSPSAGASQLGVAVTSFLTVIAYHVALSSKLPQISYLTKLDIFVFWGTILVALAMIEVVITTGLAQKERVELAFKMDRVCRVVFPSLTLLGVCYAFLWF